MQPPFSRDGCHKTMSGTSFPPRRKPLVLLTSALLWLSSPVLPLEQAAEWLTQLRELFEARMKGQSLGDGFQLSDLGTCAHHSVPQIFYQAPTMCWGQPPTLRWPLMEDVEPTFSSAGFGSHGASVPEKSAASSSTFFFFNQEGAEERRGRDGRGKRESTSCHFTLQTLGKEMRTLITFRGP